MTKRTRYLISVAPLVASAGLALGVLALLPPRPGVTKTNFDRIEVGMSKEEVISILGEDAGYDLVDGKKLFLWMQHETGPSVQIEFENGRVSQKMFCESTESISDKLRRWLNLPK